MVKVYEVGDTSYTRAANIIRNAGPDIDEKVRSEIFLNEFNLCDVGTQISLRLMYKYYKNETAKEKK